MRPKRDMVTFLISILAHHISSLLSHMHTPHTDVPSVHLLVACALGVGFIIL